MNTTDTLKQGFLQKEIKITLSNFFLASLIYLTLPVVIFFIGYLKLGWAVLFSSLTVFSAWWAWHDMAKKNAGGVKDLNERSVTVKYSYFLFLIPVVLIFLYLGGVSEFSWCVGDHRVRYAILYDLIEYKWPVIYDFSTQSNPVVAESLGSGKVAFAYYFVFWMIPALFGKVFGMMAARIVLMIWSAIGLSLVALGANLLYGKQSRFLFIALMLFAGFDVFPYWYNQFSGFGSSWEDWTWHFRVVGNFYQIMNVFHQAIPGWLITILLLLCVRSRCIGLLGSLMFCYSPWAAIGIFPMCVVKIFEANRGLKAKEVLKNIFTWGNMIAPVVFFACFASFYLANSNATYDYGFIWNFYATWYGLLLDYAAYIFFEFGIGIAAAPAVVGAGLSEELCVVVALYAVMFVTDSFNEMMQKGNKKVKPRLVILTFLVAAYTSLNFILTSVLLTSMIYMKIEPEQDMTTGIVSFGDVRDEKYLEMVQVQFYVYDYEDKTFFKYFAK